MKKTAITLLTIGLVIFLTTSIAMAGKNVPPKSACYMLDNDGKPLDGYKLAIATKKSGLSIKDSTGKVKFYNVQGAISGSSIFSNMTGSGYWDINQGQFEGNVSGMYSPLVSDSVVIHCNLYLDDSSQADCVEIPPSVGSGVVYRYDLTEIDCGLETLN